METGHSYRALQNSSDRFGYPLGEFLLLWLIASVIGWGWALIGILLSIPIGIAVMRNASAGARVVLRESDPERAGAGGFQCGALLGGAVLPGARLRIGSCRPSAARAAYPSVGHAQNDPRFRLLCVGGSNARFPVLRHRGSGNSGDGRGFQLFRLSRYSSPSGQLRRRQQSQRRSSATHDHGGLEPRLGAFQGLFGAVDAPWWQVRASGPCLPAYFWHSRAGTLEPFRASKQQPTTQVNGQTWGGSHGRDVYEGDPARDSEP